MKLNFRRTDQLILPEMEGAIFAHATDDYIIGSCNAKGCTFRCSGRRSEVLAAMASHRAEH